MALREASWPRNMFLSVYLDQACRSDPARFHSPETSHINAKAYCPSRITCSQFLPILQDLGHRPRLLDRHMHGLMPQNPVVRHACAVGPVP